MPVIACVICDAVNDSMLMRARASRACMCSAAGNAGSSINSDCRARGIDQGDKALNLH